NDDDDDDDEERKATEDDEEEEDEEHPALANSFVVPVVDHVPSVEDRKAFKTGESASTPVPSPRRPKIWLRATSPSTHHPSEMPSPPLLLPSTSHINDTPEADMPLQKIARFTNPASRFEVMESLAAAARQPVLDVATMDSTPKRLVSRKVGYGIEGV
nr:hypothetical protein [Tanacetum cinerariifolium]GFC98638.1 hypothetical protein [Tanacetum cinerariifolium]